MAPQRAALDRLMKALRLTTPVIALYDCPPAAEFEPLVAARGRACCFAYYQRWLQGETLVVRRTNDEFDAPTGGCPGLQRSLGLGGAYPPWMANFLTDGGSGAPMGEGLKATPQLAAEFLERGERAPRPAGEQLLIGPLRLERFDRVLSLTFFADPDRLSALMTLAGYWSAAPDEVAAPFSSGCGLMWREITLQERDRAVLGGTDIAMRRYLPPEILCLAVSPARFERMLGFPDNAFLMKSWWNELMDSRGIPIPG